MNAEDQESGLRALRDYVIEARRTSVQTASLGTGDKDDVIKHIIQCQDAIRAIDEAIDDERRQLNTVKAAEAERREDARRKAAAAANLKDNYEEIK